MKIIRKPNELSKFKTYFTEFDSITQELYAVVENILLKKIKAFSLLSEHIIVAASHIWESKLTRDILYKNPILLNESIVVPDLRNDCRDFVDFIEKQQGFHDYKSSVWFSPDSKDIAKYLHDSSPFFISWNPIEETKRFKEMLLKELIDEKSLIRKRLIGIKKSNIEKLIESIKKSELITRKFLIKEATKYLYPKTKAFLREINLSYYLTGAEDLLAVPTVHPGYLDVFDSKIKLISEKLKFHHDEHEVFSELLKLFSLPEDIINSLSFEKLNILRKSQIVKRFREKWWSLFDITLNSERIEKDIIETKSIGEEIKKNLYSEASLEKGRTKTTKRLKRGIMISSYLTSGIALIPTPVTLALGIASFIFGFASGPIFDKVEERVGKREFSLFSAEISRMTE